MSAAKQVQAARIALPRYRRFIVNATKIETVRYKRASNLPAYSNQLLREHKMDIQGISAVVTGGASGLGEAVVRRLVAEGAKVVIIDLNKERGEALSAELNGNAVLVAADVTNPEDVQRAIDTAKSLAPLRVAVNCAGIAVANRTLGKGNAPHDLDLFKKVININLIGTFNVSRLAAEAMAANEPVEGGDRGVIINTASVAAFDGQVGQAAYTASKAAIAGMTLPLARDLSRNGIRVASIAPGIFWTPLFDGLPEAARESLATQVPHPARLGQPSEFADTVRFIVGNPYINGETIRLDGAIRMGMK